MNDIRRIALGALLGTSCVASAYAQTLSQSSDPSTPKTRAEVIADLHDWFAAGFDPQDEIDYPVNAQKAGRIVAQRRAQAAGQAPAQQ